MFLIEEEHPFFFFEDNTEQLILYILQQVYLEIRVETFMSMWGQIVDTETKES